MKDENKPQGNSEWLRVNGLALTDEVPCDEPGCSISASHYIQLKCCNTVMLLCFSHLREMVQAVYLLMTMKKPAHCLTCGKYTDAKDWLSRPQKLALDSAGE